MASSRLAGLAAAPLPVSDGAMATLRDTSPASRGRARRRARAAARRRRQRAAVVLLAAIVSAAAGGVLVAALAAGEGHRRVPRSGSLELRAGRQPLGVLPASAIGAPGGAALRRAIAQDVPPTQVVSAGSARIVYRLDRAAVLRRALSGRRGAIEVPRRAVATSVHAPVLAQKLHNNCESAALQILLATVGVRVDQLQLQRQLQRSGPLDPQGQPPNQVWGDPAAGFVGRPDGGGAGGGFGVYQGPIRALAARHGRELRDLTGGSAAAVYDRVLSGHAVMAWVGLADGPYGHWRSPAGRSISVNFNEHTVVLTGIGQDGTLTVVNPLMGALEHWTRSRFELEWSRLSRRALST